MGKGWFLLSCCLKITLVVIIFFFINGCSYFNIVVIDDPLTAEEHNNLGYVYEYKGLFKLAEKEYKIAIKKKSDWYVPYFNLGNIEFKKENYIEAERLYRMALERDVNNADIMNNIALCLSRQKKNDEAMMMIEKALKIKLKEEYLDTLNEIKSQSSRKE